MSKDNHEMQIIYLQVIFVAGLKDSNNDSNDDIYTMGYLRWISNCTKPSRAARRTTNIFNIFRVFELPDECVVV